MKMRSKPQYRRKTKNEHEIHGKFHRGCRHHAGGLWRRWRFSRQPASESVQRFLREALRVIRAATYISGDVNQALFW
ncbi:hypothetical protein CBA19CS91_26145 [Paraburkholderia hospita]|nr:hypothetical protein CBA19CS91_26145 [Paraburkholderia hospita]